MDSIYALCCPITGAIRYIGKAKDPSKRLVGHLRDSLRKQTPVYRWMRKLGQAPEMRVLMLAWDWRGAERQLIAQARADGERLLNIADGGDEPFCSTEQRAKNGKANAAAIHSDAKRKRFWSLLQRLGVGLNKGYVSEETKAKMRAAAARRPDLFAQWTAI